MTDGFDRKIQMVVRAAYFIRSAKKNFFSDLNTMDQKFFWKTVHQLTNSSSSIPVLVQDSKKAFTSQEKADMLSEAFKKSFNSSIAPLTFAGLDMFQAHALMNLYVQLKRFNTN